MVTFTAKPVQLRPAPPPGAVILASYARAVEAAFESLGPGQLELFRATTDPRPVETVEGVLVRDRIPPAIRGSGERRDSVAVPVLRPGAQLAGSPGRSAWPFSVSA